VDLEIVICGGGVSSGMKKWNNTVARMVKIERPPTIIAQHKKGLSIRL
jgi:hypothetical protein